MWYTFCGSQSGALERIIERFGAYVSYLSSLTEDTSVRAVDRQKLVGYVRKWRDAKMLLGCAYFHDVLKSMSVLCKALQSDEICVVRALEAILKTTRAIERAKEAHLQDLPSIRKVTLRIKQDGEACTYQGANLLSYLEGVQFFKNHHQGYIDLVQSCLKQRMTEQENQLLKHALNVLAIQGWGRDDNASFGYPALLYLPKISMSPPAS